VTGEEITTDWLSSIDGVTPVNPLSNPFPNGFLQPLTTEAFRVQLGQNLNIIDRGNKSNAYTQQWNFGVQREIPGNMVVEVADAANSRVRGCRRRSSSTSSTRGWIAGTGSEHPGVESVLWARADLRAFGGHGGARPAAAPVSAVPEREQQQPVPLEQRGQLDLPFGDDSRREAVHPRRELRGRLHARQGD
jgi:hypothetical protein